LTTAPQGDDALVTDRHSPTLGRTLEALEGALHYRDWIFSLAAPYLGRRVLEFGAGSGTMFSCIVDRDHAVALEIDGELVRLLQERFGGRDNVSIIHGSLGAPGTIEAVRRLRVDSAMTFNVLEHIEDDTGALVSIAATLDPGDNLAVLVPAFPGIYGAMDRGVGHVRRYRAKELKAKMHEAGFSVLRARYVNFPGYFAWFVNGRVLRSSSPAGGARMVAAYDKTVVPATRAIERVIRPPCGQSLFVVGQRR
jgi:SAM-dependent methyltransferase